MSTHIGGEPPGIEKAPQVTTLEGLSKSSVATTATSNTVRVHRRSDISRDDATPCRKNTGEPGDR